MIYNSNNDNNVVNSPAKPVPMKNKLTKLSAGKIEAKAIDEL